MRIIACIEDPEVIEGRSREGSIAGDHPREVGGFLAGSHGARLAAVVIFLSCGNVFLFPV